MSAKIMADFVDVWTTPIVVSKRLCGENKL